MAEENTATENGTDNFSQLLARIFDQLSISAWLPALISVALVLVVAELCAHHGSPTGAFSSIGKMRGVALILLVGAVVVLAVFTQAFEFAGIRFLEGYWRIDGRLEARRTRRCDYWRAERTAILDRRRAAGEAALMSARPALLAAGVPVLTVDFLRAEVTGAAAPRSPVYAGDAERTAAEAAIYAQAEADADARFESWKARGDADLVSRWQLLDRALEEFPALDYRMLPTRLGNIVRAAEDRHHDPQLGRLEIASAQVLDKVAPTVRELYRQQRRRLNLYCGLVFVFGAAMAPVTASAGVWCWRVPGTAFALPVIVGIALWASYRAALASARLFALALAAVAAQRRLITLPQAASAGPPASGAA